MMKLPRTIETLRKRSATLQGLLARGADEAKLLKAAERVRNARIQVVRAQMGLVPVADSPKRDRQLKNLRATIDATVAMSAAAILAEFKRAIWQ
jgi:hypothetical protein